MIRGAALAMAAACLGCDGGLPAARTPEGPALAADVDGGACEADETDEAHPGALALGEEVVEFLCTPGDQDWYEFEIPEGRPLVLFRLTTEAPFTPVTYRVAILGPDGTTLASRVDPEAGRRPVRVEGLAFGTPGPARVVVENVDGVKTDPRAPYHLVVDALEDPDGAEPNDVRGEARALAGCHEGWLTWRADEDWFSFDLGAGQLAVVELRVEDGAGIAPVYEIYAAGGDDAVAGGRDGAVHALAPGAHVLRVRDPDGGEDIDAAYEICVSLAAEPDPLEGPGRNDRPGDGAPDLGVDGCQAGGRIASLGDRDWYRVAPPAGTSPSTPSVFEAEAQLERPSAGGVELALSLVRPHLGTPCAIDADCGRLRGGCRSGYDCPSYVCERGSGQCSGAGVCLPGGVCGATVWSSTLDDFDPEETRLVVRAPLRDPGEHWLLVHDFQDDEWDGDVAYTVCWEGLEEPDQGEPNGAWSPYEREDGREGAGRSADLAVTLPGQVVRNAVTGELEAVEFPCARGYVSYPGDTDWYLLPMPAEADAPTRTWHFEIDYWDGGSPLALQYIVRAGGPGNAHLGWFEGGASPALGGAIPERGAWGASECAYACHNIPRPFWLTVSEAGSRTGWDADHAYEVCARLTPGCRPELCPCGGEDGGQCPEPGQTP